MRGWGAFIAIGSVVLAGCQTMSASTDVRDQGAILQLSSAKPLDETFKCFADRIKSGWSEIYPDPVRVEVGDQPAVTTAAITIFKTSRANSVLHWEENPLWIFELQATPSGTAVHVFEDRTNPFFADTRERRIKAALGPCGVR